MDEQEPALSVVVPASNEEAVPSPCHRRRRLSATRDRLRAADGGVGPLERTAREMARAD